MTSADPTNPPPADDPQAPGNDPEDFGYETAARGWFVHVAITLAFVLFAAVFVLLYLRWSEAREPNSALLFTGNANLAGVLIRVDGPKIDAPMAEQLTKENDYTARFAIPSGQFNVTISREGQVLAQDTLNLREGLGWQVDLRNVLKPLAEPATAPTTRPD